MAGPRVIEATMEQQASKNGNPQVEDGFIRIANELWDAWMCSKLHSREERIIKVLLRFSYGTGKKYALLSKSEMAAFSNMGLSHVGETLASLEAKKIIEVESGPIPGCLKIQVDKHYLNWDVKQNLRRRTDFFQSLKRTLIRNIASAETGEDRAACDPVRRTEVPELGSEVPKTGSRVPESGSELPKKGTSTSRNGNQVVPKTGSSTSRNGNLDTTKLFEMLDETTSLKTVKDICKDSLKISTSACMGDPPPGPLHEDSSPTGREPPPLSHFFLGIVKSYPEFDVRDDDAGWFEKRAESSPLYRELDLEQELHNWEDWLETEHRKKEKKRGNKFPRSNFKSSLTNWLKKALEIRAWKGERHERDKYPERDGTHSRGDRGDDGGEIPPFSDIPPELLA